MKKFLFLLFVPNLVFAWTTNNNFAASFKDNNVKVYVDYTTVCPNLLITSDYLHDLIAPAIDDFWNQVPTSALNLESGGYSDPVPNINNGRLCSPTDDSCISTGTSQGDLIPATTDIIIACNSKGVNFGGTEVLAVTIPVKFSGKKIAGAIILINDASSFGNLSRSDQIGVIAHEIGHAIGLGHSDDKSALMYYRTVNQRKRLGQDDIDGLSFLYPMKLDLFGLSKDGLLGGCGTIDTDRKDGGPKGPGSLLQIFIPLMLMISLFHLLKRFASLSRA